MDETVSKGSVLSNIFDNHIWIGLCFKCNSHYNIIFKLHNKYRTCFFMIACWKKYNIIRTYVKSTNKKMFPVRIASIFIAICALKSAEISRLRYFLFNFLPSDVANKATMPIVNRVQIRTIYIFFTNFSWLLATVSASLFRQ